MILNRRIAVVGSREFRNYTQLDKKLSEVVGFDDELVSGGAIGVDSMAQRWAKDHGNAIHIYYPRWNDPHTGTYDRGAGFKRNKVIVENADLVLAFYQRGRFQQGGTANTAKWARELGVQLFEFEEEE